MDQAVDEKDLKKLAEKMVGELKEEGQVDALVKALKQQFWEKALEGEMDEHLGYDKHDPKGRGRGQQPQWHIQ